VVKTYEWDERHAALEGAAMLVNTTNQGMYGQPPLEIRLDALPKTAMVSDLIYIPLETPLLAAARERGNLTVNGLGMLLNQAIPAFEAWFGIKAEITEDLRTAMCWNRVDSLMATTCPIDLQGKRWEALNISKR
jgi:shikimate dehydrogenase